MKMVKIELKGYSITAGSTDPEGNSLSIKGSGDLVIECDENTVDEVTAMLEEVYYNHEA
jgi:hypothetical protein